MNMHSNASDIVPRNLYLKFIQIIGTVFLCSCIVCSCNSHADSQSSKKPGQQKVILDTSQLDNKVSHNIEEMLGFAIQHDGKLNDTIRLFACSLVHEFYADNGFHKLWRKDSAWITLAD